MITGVARQNLTSLQSHILRKRERHPGSGRRLHLDPVGALAGRQVDRRPGPHRAHRGRARRPRRMRTCTARSQQKLDVIANDILMTCLGNRPSVAVVASEEDEEPTILRRGVRRRQVLRRLRSARRLVESRRLRERRHDLLDPQQRPARSRTRSRRSASQGTQQVAAGYILYGSSTVFVLTTGQRRRHVRARPVDRIVRAREEPDPDSRPPGRPTR